MSTGEKLIRATQWQPLDGSTSNAAPGYAVVAGSQTNKVQIPVLLFDGAGSTVEYACYTTRIPVDYAAGGTFKILWMANSTSGTVKWQARVGAVTPTDPDTPLEHAWATEASSTPSVNATEARRLIETSVTLNMDSAVAGDAVSFLLSRDPGNDTCTADAELVSVAFQYTADDQAGSPLGYIDEGKVTSNQTGIGLSATDITSATVTHTYLADRRVKVSWVVKVLQQTSAATLTLSLTDGSNNVLQYEFLSLGINGWGSFAGHFVETPGAGSKTYKLRLLTSAGTCDVQSNAVYPTSLLVEDIGSSV